MIISLTDHHYESLSEALSEAAAGLKRGERIVVTADNAGALKYLTGAKKSADKTYITLSETETAGEACGLKAEKIYYPIPDASEPLSIYSDDFLPSPSDFRGISESTAESRYIFADEEALYGALSRAGAFRELAPSYIVVYSLKDDNNEKEYPSFIKYNRLRDLRYQIKTEIFKDRVVKSALTEEADTHIESFSFKAGILSAESSPLTPLKGEIGRGADKRKAITFKYIEGESLDEILESGIQRGIAPEDKIREALKLIAGFGERHNLDALFENIIISSGKPVLIDYEWVSDKPQDPGFIAYRALKYWYERHRDLLYGYKDEAGFLGAFGIGDYSLTEEKLQEAIGGKARKEHKIYLKPQTYAFTREKHEEIAKSLETIEMLNEEAKGLKAALLKEREVERLSQNHIKNIESIRNAQEEAIAILSRENEYLLRHESMPSRIKRGFIRRLDKWAPAGSRKRIYIRLMRHPFRSLRLLLTKRGRLFIRGSLEIEGFNEGGFLRFETSLDPLISVVIPVYNEVGYTYAALRSILQYTDYRQTPYEVIIADDCSSDATSHLGDYVEGVVIRKNTSNTGFLKNAANGAAAAGGRYIFFLNNDTLVHEGWLKSQFDLMEADPSIGLSGSKLIYPDGRLQEAGGIIWSDGSGWNYGRGDDPDKPEYNYLKEVDYISGAAIMIRRELFNEIGGFDERYCPAYSEDSDLAFKVRKQGFRVVYNPRSAVTHFEGVSNGTDTGDTSGLKHYQLKNQEKFKEKWAAELKSQEPNTGNPDPFTARERSKGKPLVVVIDHYVPQWDKDAGSRTTYRYIRLLLKHGFNVKFVGDNFLKEEPYTSRLTMMGVEVLYGESVREGISDWFRKHADNIDICFLNRPHIAVKYIDLLKDLGIKCIFYGHDLHFLRLRREYELSGDLESLREAERYKSMELSLIDEADMSYYPSEEEIRELRKLRPKAHLKAIPGYMWEEFNEAVAGESLAANKDLLFVGGFKHPPNRDAVSWFLREVFPKLRESIPDIRLLVAGSDADKEITDLFDNVPGAEMLGFVTDERLGELYREARIVVVPLRYGAGVKGKTVEALYFNKAVVSTPVGAEGIPDAESVLIVKDADASSFSSGIIKAYNDTEGLKDMISGIPRFMREHYSEEKAWETIKDDFLSFKERS